MTILLWLMWCAAAAVVAAGVTRWLTGWTAARGIVDRPNARSSHARSIPRGGGLSIVIVTSTVAALGAILQPHEAIRTVGWLVPALAVAIVSWLDDIRSLPTRTRLAVHVAAALAAVFVLGPVDRVDLGSFGELRFGAAAWPLTVLWIVGLTNAFNFMDGSDGIAGITAAAAGGGLAAAAAAQGSGPVAVTAAAFAGAAIGFLTRNWQPARIFMGDVGSAFCGFLLAVLPLAIRPEDVPHMIPVAVVPLWPFIFDTVYTLLHRLRAGENVFRAHRSHLYQRLTQAGWSHRGVAAVYGGLAAFGAAVVATSRVDPASRPAADQIAAASLPVVAALLVCLVSVAERRVGRPGATGNGVR